MYENNDGRFPEDVPVLVRYPLTAVQEQGGRDTWPWVPGTVLGQCGPDEWHIVVDGDEDLAEVDPDGETVYPAVFRDSSEIRRQFD